MSGAATLCVTNTQQIEKVDYNLQFSLNTPVGLTYTMFALLHKL